MAFWNESMETMPREEIERMQLGLLRKLVREMYECSPFIHERMRSAGVLPDDIRSFDDYRRIPFMKKTDLRENYPDRLFTRPYDDLVRIHVSSGTTGKPTVVGYTQNDIDNWSESLARGMVSFGMGKRDMLQNSHGYGLFTGGLGVHYGAERIGATVLPASTGNTERQIMLLRDLPVTCMAAHALLSLPHSRRLRPHGCGHTQGHEAEDGHSRGRTLVGDHEGEAPGPHRHKGPQLLRSQRVLRADVPGVPGAERIHMSGGTSATWRYSIRTESPAPTARGGR
jgi:phenylacetate-coenzyme A ligase PaaK-like adenylate-forming protein